MIAALASPGGDPATVDRTEPLLDHLVYAAPDLGAAVAAFAELTGIRPAAGGRHLGLGTRNYLVGLGPRSYLEIIGPDTEHPPASEVAMPFGVDRLTRPKLLTWAVHPPDLDLAVAGFAGAGADLGAPRQMSRRTMSGALLQWRLASAVPLPFSGVTPFLIDWERSPHPAADPALPTAALLEFTASHPDPVAVQRVLTSIGLHLAVGTAAPRLRAVLETPFGSVVLS